MLDRGHPIKNPIFSNFLKKKKNNEPLKPSLGYETALLSSSFIFYTLFNPQSSSKYPLHRFFVGNCLKTSSYVVTAAFSRPKTCNYGVGRRHHGSIYYSRVV